MKKDNYTRSEKLKEYQQQRRLNGLSAKASVETDPIYSASVAATITAEDKNQWETAYGWGDHSGLYAPVAHVGATGAAHGVATTLVNGFMSSTDKTKLDGVESGAQVNSVSSVFTRTGAVVAASGDYTATQVTNTPAGNIAATTVQAAINELDSEKQPLDATLTAISDETMGAFSHRNKIINGKMEIAQRGTSFAAATGYTLDRWLNLVNGGAVVTASQQADVPTAASEFQYSLRAAITTADTSIAASDYALIEHRIEGYNARDLIGKDFTISFWVRSSKTGTHCVSVCNSIADRSYVAQYSISTANTWEYKTITIHGGLITDGTWNWTTGMGIAVRFALAAGTAFQSTADAWNTGNFLGTANQVNCLDTVGNIFAITGVQLEAGAIATPFEHRPIGTELALCQRYYENIGYTTPAAGSMYVLYYYSAFKRTTPTITLLSGTNSGSIDAGPDPLRSLRQVNLAASYQDVIYAINSEL